MEGIEEGGMKTKGSKETERSIKLWKLCSEKNICRQPFSNSFFSDKFIEVVTKTAS